MIYRFTNPVNSRGTFGYWNDLNNSGDCYGEEFFGAENLGFICEWKNFGNDQTEFEALVGTKWKTIKLKDELNAINGINSDTDSLTDWQEVNTKLLKWNDDGSFELPMCKEIISRFEYIETLLSFARWIGANYEASLNNILERKILPVLSDPTMRDSDRDGLDDKEELYAGTKPCSPDTDNDKISDGDDIYPLKKYKFKNLYFGDYVSYNISLDKWEIAPRFVNFISLKETIMILYRFYKNIDIESTLIFVILIIKVKHQ